MYQVLRFMLREKKPVKKSIVKDLGLNNFSYPNALKVSPENLKIIIKSESSFTAKIK